MHYADKKANVPRILSRQGQTLTFLAIAAKAVTAFRFAKLLDSKLYIC